MLIPIPCHFYNQPFHTHYMPRSCQAHHPQLINPLTHAYSFISCFNIAIQPNMYQTPKNKERNRTQALSRQTLAPAERSRSGERLLSLRQASLVQASSFRLGEGSKDGNSSLCVPSFRRDLLT